jgi:hypothetical protein
VDTVCVTRDDADSMAARAVAAAIANLRRWVSLWIAISSLRSVITGARPSVSGGIVRKGDDP